MAMDRDDLAERVAALETRVAYQDDTIESLNATVTAQWSEIDRLKRFAAMLEERLEDAVGGPAPIDRPPPHY